VDRVDQARTAGEPAAWADRLLLGTATFALFSLVWHHMSLLGDSFWSVATGHLILEHWHLPSSDPFSYASVRGGTWHVVSPGCQVLFAAISDHLGLGALMAFATAIEGLAVVAVWLTWARTLLARGVVLVLAFLFIQVDSQDLCARGQIFGDLGFVALLALVLALRDRARIHPLAPAALGAAWVNLHLSFPLAILVPLGIAATLLVDPKEERPPLRPFWIFSALAAIGAMLNPSGPLYFLVAWRHAASPNTSRLDLFESPDFHDAGWLCAPAIGLAITVYRFVTPGPRRRSESLLLLGFVLAACYSRRYVAQLFTVQAAILGPLAGRWRQLERRARTGLSIAASAGLVACALPWILERKDALRDVPAEAAAFVRDGHLPDNVMNPMHWGGYLAYAWNGTPRYFIDGRDPAMLFSNGSFDDESTLEAGEPGWNEVLDAYDVHTVLWPRWSRLDWLLSQDAHWARVHADRIAVVYTRR
jgi:hypothetical protein